MPKLEQIPSDGETPLDQRRCDAFVGIVHGARLRLGHHGQPLLSWWPTSPWPPLSRTQARSAHLAGELEYGGLIDCRDGAADRL